MIFDVIFQKNVVLNNRGSKLELSALFIMNEDNKMVLKGKNAKRKNRKDESTLFVHKPQSGSASLKPVNNIQPGEIHDLCLSKVNKEIFDYKKVKHEKTVYQTCKNSGRQKSPTKEHPKPDGPGYIE